MQRNSSTVKRKIRATATHSVVVGLKSLAAEPQSSLLSNSSACTFISQLLIFKRKMKSLNLFISDLQLSLVHVDSELLPIIIKPCNHASLTDAALEALNEDTQWYIEDFPKTDPFAITRARAIERKLAEHAKALLDLIERHVLGAERWKGSQVSIWIDNTDSASVPLLKSRWELLEDISLWKPALKPAGVIVNRLAHAGNLRRPAIVPRHSTSPRHILVVTARPRLDKDIPHRLITKTIYEIVRSLEQRMPEPPTLTIIRPGSLDELSRVLNLTSTHTLMSSIWTCMVTWMMQGTHSSLS